MLNSNIAGSDSSDLHAVKYRRASTKLKPAYVHCLGENPLVYRTMGQQLDMTVEKFPNTEAIVSYFEGKRYTFTTLRKSVDCIGAGFLKLGLRSGDPIAIWAPNTIKWYLAWLAAARVGLVTVAINPAFQGPELEYCLKKVNVKAIVALEFFKTQRYYEILRSICPELQDSEVGKIKSKNLPDLKTVIIDSKARLPGALKFDDLFDIANEYDIQQVADMQVHMKADHPCNVEFTSGTTGHPKATILTHFNMVNNGNDFGKCIDMDRKIVCVQLPFFHVFGVVGTVVGALCHGSTLVIPSPGFNPEESLKAIAEEKCSVIFGTPTMYVDLVKKQAELQLPVKTIENAVTGGAPFSPQLFSDMKNIFGLKKVTSGFGMTETGVTFQTMADDDEQKSVTTVGRLLDHLEAKVVDENGDTISFGQPGELCIRGYSVMSNYYRDEDKTKEVLSEFKWLHTGDQFILYESGYGQIVGRLKEVIIRGGENIFPREVEDVLSTHPDILEICVVGVDDERMGEEVCAFIRLQDHINELTREDVNVFCKGKIAHFKIPKYVRVVKDFPKTTSGKIQKFKLRELFYKEQ